MGLDGLVSGGGNFEVPPVAAWLAEVCMTSGAGTYHWMAPEVVGGVVKNWVLGWVLGGSSQDL